MSTAMKCVIVINETLPLGLVANTAAVLGISMGQHVPDLIGPAVVDGSGVQVLTGIFSVMFIVVPWLLLLRRWPPRLSAWALICASTFRRIPDRHGRRGSAGRYWIVSMMEYPGWSGVCGGCGRFPGNE